MPPPPHRLILSSKPCSHANPDRKQSRASSQSRTKTSREAGRVVDRKTIRRSIFGMGDGSELLQGTSLLPNSKKKILQQAHTAHVPQTKDVLHSTTRCIKQNTDDGAMDPFQAHRPYYSHRSSLFIPIGSGRTA